MLKKSYTTIGDSNKKVDDLSPHLGKLPSFLKKYADAFIDAKSLSQTVRVNKRFYNLFKEQAYYRKRVKVKSRDIRLISNSNSYFLNLPDKILKYILERYLNNRESKRLFQCCIILYYLVHDEIYKRSFLRLLQATIDEDRAAVKSILNTRPELLIASPSDAGIPEIESKLTWLKFKTEKVFIMALKLKRLEMVKTMIPYLDSLDLILKISNDDKLEFKPEIDKQWIMYPSLNMQEQKRDHEHLQLKYTKMYLQPVIDAILKDDCIDEIVNQYTEGKLEILRKSLLKNEAIEIDQSINIEQLIIAAFRVYKSSFKAASNQQIVFGVHVIGFIQSLVSPELAKAYCNSLGRTVRLGLIYLNERNNSLKLSNDRMFYHPSRDARTGLGFKYFCGSKRYGYNYIHRLNDEQIEEEIELLQQYIEKNHINLVNYKSFYRCCITPSPVKLRELIATKINVNIYLHNNTTALTNMTIQCNLECMKLLIEARADLNHQINDYNTALTLAVSYNHTDAATLLLESKADPNVSIGLELYYAIRNKNNMLFDLLLDNYYYDTQVLQDDPFICAFDASNVYAFNKLLLKNILPGDHFRNEVLTTLNSSSIDRFTPDNHALCVYGLFKGHENNQNALTLFKDYSMKRSSRIVTDYLHEQKSDPNNTQDKESIHKIQSEVENVLRFYK